MPIWLQRLGQFHRFLAHRALYPILLSTLLACGLFAGQGTAGPLQGVRTRLPSATQSGKRPFSKAAPRRQRVAMAPCWRGWFGRAGSRDMAGSVRRGVPDRGCHRRPPANVAGPTEI